MARRGGSEAGISTATGALVSVALAVAGVAGLKTVAQPLLADAYICPLRAVAALEPDRRCGERARLQLAQAPRQPPPPPIFHAERLDQVEGGGSLEVALLRRLTPVLHAFWLSQYPDEYQRPLRVLVTGQPEVVSRPGATLIVSLWQLRRRGGGLGSAAFILAHEWAHELQRSLGLALSEPEADCFAGIALRAAQHAGVLGEYHIADALRGVFWQHHWQLETGHGTGQARQAGLERGLGWRPGQDPRAHCTGTRQG